MARSIVLVSAALLACAAPREPRTGSPTLLLSGAGVLDERGESWRTGVDVLVANGRIAKIGPAGSITAPAESTRIDLTGTHLLPGLIDLHSHLLLHPYDETPWDQQVLRESLEARTIRATVAARTTVESGFTTLRDLGTEGAGYADVALRDAIEAGTIPGPRLFATTRAIVATGCYAIGAGYDARWTLPKGAEEATGVDEVRRVVRGQIAAGADWIKVYADYRRAKGDPATPTFSQEELDALVDEARSAGKKVAAHATTDEGIRRAVKAGVATIEHGYGASAETLKTMKEKGVVLCPTLAAADAVARYAGWDGKSPDPAGVAESKAMFARALASGVTIACGSDVGVFPHGESAREIELMVAYGMKPADAVRAATTTAAATLGHEKDFGRVAEGFIADLVCVRGDPLQDPAHLREIVLVVKSGRVVVDRR